MPGDRRVSDASGSAVSDGDLVAIHDDRHFASTVRGYQHLLQAVGVVFDVDVANRSVLLGIVLTGCHGVRSSVFSVDQDFVSHERIISEVWGESEVRTREPKNSRTQEFKNSRTRVLRRSCSDGE